MKLHKPTWNDWKKLFRTIKSFIFSRVFILLVLGAFLVTHVTYTILHRGQIEPKTKLTVTNTNAVNYTMADFLFSLEYYNDIYTSVRKNGPSDYGTYVIPGLKATKTTTASGKMAMCTSMTPQGLAVTDKYLIISAYCYTHSHNSVLYLLDKETHKFLKEIVLWDQSHVGGLAYDSEHHILWISGQKNGVAYANSYTIDQLELYDLNRNKKPLPFHSQDPLYTLTRNSFMTYHDGDLYAGYFSLDGDSVIEQYPIMSNGKLLLASNRKISNSRNLDILAQYALPTSIADISRQVQGIAFAGDYIFLSQSYGLGESKLRIYHNTLDDPDTKKYDFRDENAIRTITLPSKLEQIYVSDTKVYMLFEGGAYSYRWEPIFNVDRVISIDLERMIR